MVNPTSLAEEISPRACRMVRFAAAIPPGVPSAPVIPNTMGRPLMAVNATLHPRGCQQDRLAWGPSGHLAQLARFASPFLTPMGGDASFALPRQMDPLQSQSPGKN